MVWGYHRDRKDADFLSPEEVAAALLVSKENRSFHEPEVQAKGRARACCGACCARCRACATGTVDGMVWLVSTMFEVQAADSVLELLDVKLATVNRCITSIHAYRTGACRQSIRAVMLAVRRSSGATAPEAKGHRSPRIASIGSPGSRTSRLNQSWRVICSTLEESSRPLASHSR